MSLIIAIDQGTSATKGVAVDDHGRVTGRASRQLRQQFPKPGWAEQDAAELWQSVAETLAELVGGQPDGHVAGVALSTQRESIVTWDATTGLALAPVLSWQDHRSAAWCRELAEHHGAGLVRSRTGLPVDPMFSAPKLRWLLTEHSAVRDAACDGRLRAGTVDAWLLYRLTGEHACEIGNASRTQLMCLDNSQWDDDLLDVFAVPRSALPDIRPSTGPFGVARGVPGVADGLPVLSVLGDSHAALFAHAGFRPGVVKATFGTGSSVMAAVPAGTRPQDGLARTIAWQQGAAAPVFAVEANIAAAGAAVRWLAELLGRDEDDLARLADDAGDAEVVLVPAFNGLGAPYWDTGARAVLVGMTQATRQAQLARAAIESIAFQVADAFTLIDKAIGGTTRLRADGGASGNDMLMRFLADLIDRPVARAASPEASALGAAYLGGLSTGIWSTSDIASFSRADDMFHPSATPEWRVGVFAKWRDALARATMRRKFDDHGALRRKGRRHHRRRPRHRQGHRRPFRGRGGLHRPRRPR